MEKKNVKRRPATPSKYVPSNKKSYGWFWGVLVVLVVAAIVTAGIVMGVKSDNDKASGADIGLKNATVSVDETFIEFKSSDVEKKAKVLELYEDPRCPLCVEMEKNHGADFAEAIESNKVIVRFHLMDFLNSQGSTQYSTRTNAALLTVALTGDAEATFRYHSILWHTAPAEGQGVVEPTNEELADKARQAGASSEAAKAIASGNFETMRAATMGRTNLKVLNDRMDSQAGTPAAFVNGKMVDTADPDWVTNLFMATVNQGKEEKK